ncbi:hypothetical protein ASG22_02940 [Chryseobacterium sp. Leaf405]|uniref:STM3941 family protein n=1 Tax=Chryseobacterium sp. Leaf405 TaxID=1736367 RepID=UPI0006FE787D|nr:STM3941 family protein [Chryseobacterium sp. Leaf405]KQT25684.1 hypothetical protein ASG22_02940 [Chryseobacterium sp. Leaf405]
MQKLPVTFYPGKLKHIILAIASLVFVILGISIIRGGSWLGLFPAFFFGICLTVFIINLIPNSSYLKISEKGFEMRTMFRSTFIPWEVVTGFSVKRIAITKMVIIEFNNQYIDTSKLKSKTGAFPDTYGMPAQKLAEIMNEYKAQSGR